MSVLLVCHAAWSCQVQRGVLSGGDVVEVEGPYFLQLHVLSNMAFGLPRGGQ